MSETLDFVVGGMPRGGTTAVGNLFNVHPDSYCYAAETHWLPLLMEFAEFRPVPKSSIDKVKRIALMQNRQVLFEMARFSVTRGAHARALIFEESDLLPLTDAMVALMRKGLWGSALCESALPILREHIQTRTGKNTLGEKTPNNVLAFDAYGSVGTKNAFMVLREPFAVIRSMQNRGKDESDVYAGPFRSELIVQIGIWISYVEAIYNATHQPKTTLLTYEKLMEQPIDLIDEIYRSVDLQTSDEILNDAGKHFREITKGEPWADFSPSERTLVWHLTRWLREHFGYDDEFYKRRGFNLGSIQDCLGISDNRVTLIHGMNLKTEHEGGQWLMKKGAMLLQSLPGKRTLTLTFHSNFPKEILGSGGTAVLHLYADREKQQLVGRVEVPAKQPEQVSLDIDLAKIEPLLKTSAGEIRVLEFEANQAYRSYLTPLSSNGLKSLISGRFKRKARSSDRRLISFALIDSKFS